MSTSPVPPLFVGLVDDAASFPLGGPATSSGGCESALTTTVTQHRRHRAAWYGPIVGALLLPLQTVGDLDRMSPARGAVAVSVIADVRRDSAALRNGAVLRLDSGLAAGFDVRQVEAAVAKRGEDPMPGLEELLALAATFPSIDVYAEVPLSFGLLGALDSMAEARADGVRIAAKFRTGGLARELFPTPVELAAVICACRDRGLRFKLTTGLHRAVRHSDPETGFTHHGFVNVLVASVVAAGGAEVVTVAEWLATMDPVTLAEVLETHRSTERPLWTGFGSYSVAESVRDLEGLGVLPAETSS